jgi:hypothetical protein
MGFARAEAALPLPLQNVIAIIAAVHSCSLE